MDCRRLLCDLLAISGGGFRIRRQGIYIGPSKGSYGPFLRRLEGSSCVWIAFRKGSAFVSRALLAPLNDCFPSLIDLPFFCKLCISEQLLQISSMLVQQ
jgi:hypothetical protein